MAWILKTMLIFMLMDVECIHSVGPNAKLNATSTTQKGSQVLECTYIVSRNWTAVQWFNGSILYPLILERIDLDGNVRDFANRTSPFDKDRVKGSCNFDICSLEINLLPKDDNSNILCSFLDPYPSETKANFTLKVPSSPDPNKFPGGQTLDRGAIAGILVAVLVFSAIIVIFIACLMKHYNSRGTYSLDGNKDTNDSSPMEPLHTNQQVSKVEQMNDKLEDVLTDGVAKRDKL